MDKAKIEAFLPQLQQRHNDLMDEGKRIEGEFRAYQNILNNWEEADEGEKEDQAVDAQNQPEE